MNLQTITNENKEQITVNVSGEIDAFTAPKLREELMPLAEKENANLVINLRDVSYMDSTGLGVFVGLLKAVRKNGGKLKLVELSDRLARLFSITGLNDIIDISSKAEDGVQ